MTCLLSALGVVRILRQHQVHQSAVAISFVLVLALWPTNPRAEWFGERIDLMGTSVSVELWHEDSRAGQALVAAILDEYRRIDEQMSTYRADSEISLINRVASTQSVTLSAELFELISTAQSLAMRSGGAFDISYESVGYLYDFRARERPSDTEIGQRIAAVDYRAIELGRSNTVPTIRFELPGMKINLGGIAKGYAVERASEILQEASVEYALLNAGGDTRVIGDRRGKPWIVGIRHPRVDDEIVTRIPLVDEAISTSGDYERFFDEDGERFHHIINPVTGKPTDELMSVTVIGPNAVLTDGLSTTVFVLGQELGLALIDSYPDYEAIVVSRSGTLNYSSGLADPASQ